MLDVVRRTAEGIYMPLTVGGGVRTVDDVRRLLRAGADKVSLNTAALARPAVIREAAERFGSQCIVVAIDARRTEPPGALLEQATHASSRARCHAAQLAVYTHGGRRSAGRDAVAWAREAVALGAGEILLTSMDRDGTKDGYDLELTRAVAEAVSVPGHRLRRRRLARALLRGARRGRRRRGAGRVALPLRHPHDRRGEGLPAPSAASRCGGDARRAEVRRAGADPGRRAGGRDGRGADGRVDGSRRPWRPTLATGLTHFWSRSRQAPWRKGETSGHSPARAAASTPTATPTRCWCRCTRTAWPATPARRTCFFTALQGPGAAGRTCSIASSRSWPRARRRRRPARTWPRCWPRARPRVCRKIGEEAVEVVTAALGGEGDRRVVEEVADLWFHTLVLLGQRVDPAARRARGAGAPARGAGRRRAAERARERGARCASALAAVLALALGVRGPTHRGRRLSRAERIPGHAAGARRGCVAADSRADLELRHRTGSAGDAGQRRVRCPAVARRDSDVLARHLLIGLRDRAVVEAGRGAGERTRGARTGAGRTDAADATSACGSRATC